MSAYQRKQREVKKIFSVPLTWFSTSCIVEIVNNYLDCCIPLQKNHKTCRKNPIFHTLLGKSALLQLNWTNSTRKLHFRTRKLHVSKTLWNLGLRPGYFFPQKLFYNQFLNFFLWDFSSSVAPENLWNFSDLRTDNTMSDGDRPYRQGLNLESARAGKAFRCQKIPSAKNCSNSKKKVREFEFELISSINLNFK